VPASHYLSLTGSKFGLNAFEEDARTTRSKSPFEWWNTLKEKRRSQHLEDGLEPHDIYTRRDAAASGTSLEKPEKSPTAQVYEVEPIEPTPALSRPARHTSFSRPFQMPAYPESDSDSIRNQRHNRNLSMIKEASPHASMISSRSLERRSSRLSAYNPGEASRQERRPSDHSSSSQRRRPSTGSQSRVPRPSQQSTHSQRPNDPSQTYQRRSSDGRNSSQRASRRPSQNSSRQPSDRSSRSNRSDRSNRSPHKQSRPSQQASHAVDSGTSLPYHPRQQSSTEVPRPIAYRGSRHSLGEHEPQPQPANPSNTSLSKRSSLVSRHDSLTEHTELSRRPSRPKSLVLDDSTEYQQHQGPEYWASREEMMPDLPTQPTTPTTPTNTSGFPGGRTPSVGKKGNVLRKKSLKRQEVVSYVST
jgi:hypothetical protein